MFPYCCLLIICIMLFPCSVFKVHLSLFAQRRPRFLPRTSFNEYISKKRFLIVREADTSIFHFSLFIFHSEKWWAKVDSNHRPHDYQSCALASWAKPPWRRDKFHILRFGLKPKAQSFHCLSFPHKTSFCGVPEHTFRSAPSKLNNVNCFLHLVLTLGH